MPTLYRVENQQTMIGLWYNADGEKTDFIKSIPDALCRDLPMDYDPSLAGGWHSAGATIEQMSNWFQASDVATLSQAGYRLYEVVPRDYRVLPHHAVFRREGALFTPIPIDLLDLT